MTIEEMRVRKTQLRYTYAKIAELSGLPLGTVQKVLTGATASPRTSTMQALESVLGVGVTYEAKMPDSTAGTDRQAVQKQQEAPKDGLYPYSQQPFFEELLRKSGKRNREDHPGSYASDIRSTTYGTGSFPDMVRESAPAYDVTPGRTIFGNPRGQYTLKDYYALPDDQRVELIDGYFFVMEAPTSMHQELLVELVFRFKDYQRKKRPDCRVFPAPFDVQLDKDAYTMLQPDISIICDRSRIMRRGCFGAPDFVVEILSDSTREKDMYMKLAKYKKAGVREYWIVDPKKKRVLVYFYEDEDRIAVYRMDEKVPVGISGGDLEIDFAGITEELRYLESLEK